MGLHRIASNPAICLGKDVWIFLSQSDMEDSHIWAIFPVNHPTSWPLSKGLLSRLKGLVQMRPGDIVSHHITQSRDLYIEGF